MSISGKVEQETADLQEHIFSNVIPSRGFAAIAAGSKNAPGSASLSDRVEVAVEILSADPKRYEARLIGFLSSLPRDECIKCVEKMGPVFGSLSERSQDTLTNLASKIVRGKSIGSSRGTKINAINSLENTIKNAVNKVTFGKVFAHPRETRIDAIKFMTAIVDHFQDSNDYQNSFLDKLGGTGRSAKVLRRQFNLDKNVPKDVMSGMLNDMVRSMNERQAVDELMQTEKGLSKIVGISRENANRVIQSRDLGASGAGTKLFSVVEIKKLKECAYTLRRVTEQLDRAAQRTGIGRDDIRSLHDVREPPADTTSNMRNIASVEGGPVIVRPRSRFQRVSKEVNDRNKVSATIHDQSGANVNSLIQDVIQARLPTVGSIVVEEIHEGMSIPKEEFAAFYRDLHTTASMTPEAKKEFAKYHLDGSIAEAIKDIFSEVKENGSNARSSGGHADYYTQVILAESMLQELLRDNVSREERKSVADIAASAHRNDRLETPTRSESSASTRSRRQIVGR